MENDESILMEKHKSTPSGIGIPVEVFCNYQLTQTEKMLFGYIQNLSKSSKGCWASNKYLGKITGVGEQSITNSLRTLQDYQYIVVELEKSPRGISRHIFINPNYLVIYKPLVEIFYDNLDQLDADPLLEKLCTTIKRIIDPHKKNYDIKEYIKGDVKDTSSKEDDGSEEPSLERSIRFTNLRPIRISPYRNFKEEAKELFLYWNGKGKPLTKHLEKSKTFTVALTSLDILIRRKYTVEEIKRSIDNYFWLITWKEFLLAGSKKSGTVVGLPEFIKFGKDTNERMVLFNPLLIEKGVTSWFEECLNTRDVLEQRWSKLVKDMYPKETKKLKELWYEFGGRQLDPVNDENIFRQISKKAHNYFESLNGKYQWGTEERYPIARLHHLFDVGQAEGWDWKKAHPKFLLSPKMFEEKLPAHWGRIAMAEALTDTERKERDNTPEARERMEFNSHFSHDPNSTRERTLAMIASQAKNQKEETVDELRDY